jgi:hypothetical protein
MQTLNRLAIRTLVLFRGVFDWRWALRIGCADALAPWCRGHVFVVLRNRAQED